MMINKLKPYSPASVCPICGHERVKARYNDGYVFISTMDVPGATFDRQCTNCLYQWVESSPYTEAR